MRNKTIDEFCEVLASSEPTPGGGGASALAGALSASLSQMVTSLTIGKKKYSKYQKQLQDISNKMESLRNSLLDCIEKDKKAFEPLSKVYKLPKDTPNYDQLLENCLRQAAKVPFKILDLTCQVIKYNDLLVDIGSKLAISDSATCAAIASGTLYAACANVKVNTNLMSDKKYAQDLEKKADKLVEEYHELAMKTYNKILERLRSNG